MYRPWIALTRVYLNRTLLYIVPALAFTIAAPWLFGRLIGLTEDFARSDSNPLGLYFSFVGFGCALGLTCGAILLDVVRAINIRALPLSNSSLATFLCLVPAALIVVVSLLLQYGYRIVFGIEWPVLTTTLSIVAFCMLSMSLATWLHDFRFRRLALALTCIVGSIVWFVSRSYPTGFRGPVNPWVTPTIVEAVTLAAVMTGAWWLQVFAFTRMRSRTAELHWIFRLTEQDVQTFRQNAPTTRVSPHATPLQALHAMIGETGRSLTIVGGVGFGIVTVLMVGCVVIDGDSRPRAIAIVPTIASVAGLAIGMVAPAIWVCAGRRLSMRSFLGSQPFSSAELSRALLRSTVKSTITVTLVISAITIILPVLYFVLFDDRDVASALSGVFEPPRVLAQRQYSPYWSILILAAVLPLAVTTAGLAATVASAGRTWIIMATYLIVFGLPFVVLVLQGFAGPPGKQAADAIVLIASVLIATATGACVVAARQKGLIRPHAVAGCAAVVLAGGLAMIYAARGEPYYQVLGCCAISLLVLPVAAHPLAIAWNRHR